MPIELVKKLEDRRILDDLQGSRIADAHGLCADVARLLHSLAKEYGGRVDGFNFACSDTGGSCARVKIEMEVLLLPRPRKEDS